MKIDPWSSKSYQDYARLRDEFGIQAFTEECWKDLPSPHRLFRRGVVFGQRGFETIHAAILMHKPWAILTGLMPSGRMHLGHKMVIDEVVYYQSIGADVAIAVADIEAYATRGMTLAKAKELAINEYIINYIALGLRPERCRIYFQSQNEDVKDLAYLLGRKVNWSQLVATYGFDGSTNLAHVFSPLVQAGDILHVQLPKYGGVRPTLVPVGVDQDPHIRLCRDIAQDFRLYSVLKTKDDRIGVFVKGDEKVSELLDNAETIVGRLGFSRLKRITEYNALYLEDATESDIDRVDEQLAVSEPAFGGYGFLQPSSTYHRFITGLTGDKMSSSKPESSIFLTDTPQEAKKKMMNAKTGGAATREEQERNGGKPDECIIYELYLYHLLESDAELQQLHESCKKGTILCGACKKRAAELLEALLVDIQQKRATAEVRIPQYLSPPSC
jgi:tryptophanyl-tRNA synthetase